MFVRCDFCGGLRPRWAYPIRDARERRACDACRDSLDTFAGIYGAEAGNLALRGLATAGVYLGGGIAPRLLDALEGSTFERAFRDKEPHAALLAEIPVWLILDDRAALWGAARHASLALP